MAKGADGFERSAQFPTTSWSAILSARSPSSEISREALGKLCSSYWYPVFAFIRRKGINPDQARDRTQDFFTALLEKNYLADIDSSKGRFRSFLLAAATHFVANSFDAERAQKRGGGRQFLPLEAQNGEQVYGHEATQSLTPEALFEYHWAANLLERTLKQLRAAYAEHEFELLKPFLVGEAERGDGCAAAKQLGMSEGAFKVAIHRMRKRYAKTLRAEVAETVSDPTEVEGEIRYLVSVLARGSKGTL
jgi:RNA polymerase sigma-70 factor (ECF subfamily)